MKINWGTSIVIAFGLFMAFILYFVIKVQGSSKYENELVVDEYYKYDARFGEEMAKLQNARNLTDAPTVNQVPEGIQIVFAESFDPQKISGDVSFYRPSDKRLDTKFLLRLTGHSQLISKRDFVGGLWNMTLSWKYGGKEFMIKKEIYLN